MMFPVRLASRCRTRITVTRGNAGSEGSREERCGSSSRDFTRVKAKGVGAWRAMVFDPFRRRRQAECQYRCRAVIEGVFGAFKDRSRSWVRLAGGRPGGSRSSRGPSYGTAAPSVTTAACERALGPPRSAPHFYGGEG